MIRRPNPGENEDDILCMQEEFLSEKIKNKNLQPSAQVVNLRETTKRTNASSSGSRKPSRYAQSKGLTNNSEKRPRIGESVRNLVGDILEKNVESTCSKISDTDDDKVYFPKILPSIVGSIIEKNINAKFDFEYIPMPPTGFPVVLKKDEYLSMKNTNNIVDQLKENKHEMKCDELPMNMESCPNLNLPVQSYILSNDEADQIHSENVKFLSTMTESQILEERKKLRDSIAPKLLEFIKSKRKIISERRETESMEVTETYQFNNVLQTSQVDTNSLWDNDVLSHPNINEWLHFNNLETDKLEWIKSIQEIKSNSDEPFEARFDFKGYLLPYTIEYNENTKSLFHHGEEAHRPGYSLTELIELSRSNVTQQRVLAINTIAGILEYYNLGTFKDIIEIPLSKIFFVIRISMDVNKVIILEPALKAMRNLLVNRVDEASLDALIGFKEGTFQPCLENDKSEIEEIESKEAELKDFHLAEIDIITALLRTNILQRVYYIIDQIKPTFNCIQYSLQILTRLARDSLETCNKIVQTEHLMNALIEHFLPSSSVNFMFTPDIVYNKPILAALKLFRVLSLTSKEIAEQLISSYNILKSISEYVNSGVDGTYGLKLQMESFLILSNFLKFNLGFETIKSLCPVVTTTLFKHVQGTNIFMNSCILSASHAAVVLQFINGIINCDINIENKAQIYLLLKEGMQKWLTQLAQLDEYSGGHLRLVCSILNCLETVIVSENIPIEALTEGLVRLSTSRGFKKLIDNLIYSSNLLSGIEDTKIHFTKNLMSLGTSVLNSQHHVQVLPILNPLSPLPLLGSLYKLLCILNNKAISQVFLECTIPYLKDLTIVQPRLVNNWFTRMETDFLFSLVRLFISSDCPEPLKDLVYAVSSKLCYILRIDKRKELNYLFTNIIFNKVWFTTERLFNLVSLSEVDGFSKALNDIEDIKMCYSDVINLNYVDTGPFVLYKKWQNPILPRDWLYLPILSLYGKSQEILPPTLIGDHAAKVVTKISADKEIIIRSSLEWILFNEVCFPDLLNDIDVSDKFCRILCVFLCDNSIFLDKKVKILLKKCTQLLFKKGDKFNFNKELLGLHSFQDFYTQLLEQFQSVSYGDHTFAACVLVPLAQQHNVKWRKLVWSEYAGCLRALDCPESSLCYGINAYLYPEETEESVLMSYHRALTSNLLRPHTVAYKIAHHHVENFMKHKVTK